MKNAGKYEKYSLSLRDNQLPLRIFTLRKCFNILFSVSLAACFIFSMEVSIAISLAFVSLKGISKNSAKRLIWPILSWYKTIQSVKHNFTCQHSTVTGKQPSIKFF